MEIGEVRICELDGKQVWMKRLAENFYFINGAYCVGDGTLDMESVDVIRRYLGWVEDPDIVYPGADKGYVIMFTRMSSSGYCVSYEYLDIYDRMVSAADCEEALHEYEAWIVLQG